MSLRKTTQNAIFGHGVPSGPFSQAFQCVRSLSTLQQGALHCMSGSEIKKNLISEVGAESAETWASFPSLARARISWKERSRMPSVHAELEFRVSDTSEQFNPFSLVLSRPLPQNVLHLACFLWSYCKCLCFRQSASAQSQPKTSAQRCLKQAAGFPTVCQPPTQTKVPQKVQSFHTRPPLLTTPPCHSQTTCMWLCCSNIGACNSFSKRFNSRGLALMQRQAGKQNAERK